MSGLSKCYGGVTEFSTTFDDVSMLNHCNKASLSRHCRAGIKGEASLRRHDERSWLSDMSLMDVSRE